MQTRFTEQQRQRPGIRESEAILRKCVHCGFCSATCPTYQLLGDELDSPRGRIYLIKDMLENDRAATPEIVQHVDRCLSCLACMTTCPSGVHYQHLVDHARAHIEATWRRPLPDRWMRSFLAFVMPYPARFRWLLRVARLARPFAAVLPGRLRSALALVPRGGSSTPPLKAAPAGSGDANPSVVGGEQVSATDSEATMRAAVGVMTGCVQSVLGAAANQATFRLLARMGLRPIAIDGCCGSLTHHLGKEASTRRFAATFIGKLRDAGAARPLTAIAVNASGCGTHLKDYGFVFRNDPELADAASDVSRIARDITEIVAGHGLPTVIRPGGLRVAYHSACSMQHGQQLHLPPRDLLRSAGFEVVEIPEPHLCCGSAGTYNMLQPEIAAQLAERKLQNINSLEIDVIAAGNLGCMTQLSTGADKPIVHTVELLDWATGGPVPAALGHLA